MATLPGGFSGPDKEVCSETVRVRYPCGAITVESKLFYLDLKENSRGRYLKVSEKGTGRERSTIIVPAAGVVWFMDLFNYYTGGGDDNGALSNKELQLETKVFYFDVGENPRGRFLRISEGRLSSGPQRAPGPRGRTSLIIPSAGAGDIGWVSFRDTLVRIHEAQQVLPQPDMAEGSEAAAQNNSSFFSNGGVGGGGGAGAAGARVVTTSSSTSSASVGVGVGPAVQQAGGGGLGPGDPGSSSAPLQVPLVRAGNKRFFFDLGSNPRGSFLRITEVVGVDRTSIIVPTEALPQFYEAMEHVLATQTTGGPGGDPSGHRHGGPPQHAQAPRRGPGAILAGSMSVTNAGNASPAPGAGAGSGGARQPGGAAAAGAGVHAQLLPGGLELAGAGGGVSGGGEHGEPSGTMGGVAG